MKTAPGMCPNSHYPSRPTLTRTRRGTEKAFELFYFPLRAHVRSIIIGPLEQNSENLERLRNHPSKQKAVKHIIATIFSAQDALRDLAPEQRWAGMGNLLGDYGEYMLYTITISRRLPEGQMVTTPLPPTA